MRDVVVAFGFLAAWWALNAWVLPRLGIGT